MSEFFRDYKKFYFIGIGGSGMSNLAMLLKSAGCSICGSDVQRTSIITNLENNGIKITLNQNGADLITDTDIVVRTAAVNDKHPEVLKAKELNIPVVKYSRLVGLLMREKIGIAVSGTHGKTTTTTLISEILNFTDKKPAYLIGGVSKRMNSGGFWGSGHHFVLEACEYDRSFLEYNPTFAAITNIEAEHLDFYKDLKEIEDAFAEFIRKVPSYGKVFLNADNESCMKIAGAAKCPVITFGFSQSSNYRAEIVNPDSSDFAFRIYKQNQLLGTVQPVLPGKHVVMNMLASTAITLECDTDFEAIKNVLEKFQGSKRRFDFIGKYNGAEVYDDYGHHPTELDSVIKAAKAKFADKNLIFVFQPHQAFRTQIFLSDFAKILSKADKIILTSIFAAREENSETNKILMQRLLAEVKKLNANADYIETFDGILQELKQSLKENDVLFTVGAGNIYLVAESLVHRSELSVKSA